MICSVSAWDMSTMCLLLYRFSISMIRWWIRSMTSLMDSTLPILLLALIYMNNDNDDSNNDNDDKNNEMTWDDDDLLDVKVTTLLRSSSITKAFIHPYIKTTHTSLHPSLNSSITPSIDQFIDITSIYLSTRTSFDLSSNLIYQFSNISHM